MPIFLLYIFVKGPLWLRAIAWVAIVVVLLFAILLTVTKPDSRSIERLHLDHVNSTHHPSPQPQRR